MGLLLRGDEGDWTVGEKEGELVFDFLPVLKDDNLFPGFFYEAVDVVKGPVIRASVDRVEDTKVAEFLLFEKVPKLL